MFFKDIFNENERSFLRIFYEIQVRKTNKGDWASTCIANIKQLKTNLSTEEIRNLDELVP